MILLGSNNNDLLYETKQMLSETFEMKDPGESPFMLAITICREDLMDYWVYLKGLH